MQPISKHRVPKRRAISLVRRSSAACLVSLAVCIGWAASTAEGSGPYVFCERSYPAYDTCVGGNDHVFTEVQARDLNGSNRVCATQKSGSRPNSPNQYPYACADYRAGVVNVDRVRGYPAAHNGESWSQTMRGQFYL